MKALLTWLRLPRADATPRARMMRRRQWGLGLLATLVVVLGWLVGLLEPIERWSLDQRARLFDAGATPPSSAIALIAIDDAAQWTVGRWPWRRSKMAAVIRELKLAGVKVVALDITYEYPSEVERGVAGAGASDLSDDDSDLATAIGEHAGVIGAIQLPLRAGRGGPADRQLVVIPVDRLVQELLDTPSLRTADPSAALAALRPKLLPPSALAFTRGPEADELRQKYRAAMTILDAQDGSSIPVPPEASEFPSTSGPVPPLREISARTADLATVTFDSFDPDGPVRRVPVFIRYRDRLWPSLGLSAALHYLGVPLAQVRVTRDAVEIPIPGGPTHRLPLTRGTAAGSTTQGLYLVTWPRALSSKTLPDSQVPGWQWQFWDTSTQTPAEFPIGRVYEPVRVAETVMDNVRAMRLGMDGVLLAGSLNMLDAAQKARWDALAPRLVESQPDDPAFAKALAEAGELVAAAVDAAKAYLDFAAPAGTDLSTLPAEDRGQIESIRDAAAKLPRNLQAARDGLVNIASLRAQAKQRLSGKLAIVGWTATGAAADFVGSSIDPRTPGPLIHAAVANAVLTGFARSPSPLWADLLAIGVLGVVGTMLGIRATVLLAPLGAGIAIVSWFLLSGAVIWDRWWVITSVAGPGASAAAGVGVVILHRLIVEQRSRRKTEERFKSYLSPAVVDILVNNPELDSMKPWRKTLSIMFTDLAGFTTTAERLGGDRTAEVLAKFLGRMTEIVQSTGATLDKYIGDAILAFWGAPIDDELHARHACEAAVLMIRTLDEMNAAGEFGDAGTLVMRVGIASGEVMVGDFGNPPRNSSYTVIGDTANLASRLEGANKAFGSRILVAHSTREMAGDGFTFRIIGDVKVKGRTGATRLYELIAGEPKGERTAEWIRATATMVEAYRGKDFDACLSAAETLEREFKDRTLAGLYRDEVARVREDPAHLAAFDGSITLTEK